MFTNIVILIRKFQKFPKGKLSLILFATLIIISILISFLKGFLTPFSVHVSGYNRSNGVAVSSYNRRPSGSRVHDKRYEDLISILMFIWIGNFIGLFLKIIETIALSKYELLNEEKYKHINMTLKQLKPQVYRKNKKIIYTGSQQNYNNEVENIKQLYREEIERKFKQLYFRKPTEIEFSEAINYLFMYHGNR